MTTQHFVKHYAHPLAFVAGIALGVVILSNGKHPAAITAPGSQLMSPVQYIAGIIAGQR